MQDKPRKVPKERLRICKCKTNILTGSWNVRTSFRTGSASLLLKRMQLPRTKWVPSRKSRDDSRGKAYRSCQEHESQSLRD